VIHFADQEGPLAHRRKRRATTPLGNKVKAVLNRLKGEYGNTEYVIPKGLDGCYSSFEKPFALAAKNARLSWVTPHVLRHTACSLLLKQKRTMVEASQFLGHSSVAITQSYYAHFDPEFLKGATQALDSL
jgi:integrase